MLEVIQEVFGKKAEVKFIANDTYISVKIRRLEYHFEVSGFLLDDGSIDVVALKERRLDMVRMGAKF